MGKRTWPEAGNPLRQIVDNASVAMFVKDLDGTFLYVNRAFERLTGLPREAIVGRNDAQVFAADADAFRRNDRRVTEQRRAFDFEETVESPEGTRTYLSHKFPLEQINEAFRQQEDGHITRGAIVPN